MPLTLDELVPMDHHVGFAAEVIDALDRDDWTALGGETVVAPLA